MGFFQTEQKEKYRKPYEPGFDMPTNQFERIIKYNTPPKQRGKTFVLQYQPQNALEIPLKDILLTPSYQNCIGITSKNLLPYIVKILDNMKMKFTINNAHTRVELAWPFFAFTSLSCYLNEYGRFINPISGRDGSICPRHHIFVFTFHRSKASITKIGDFVSLTI